MMSVAYPFSHALVRDLVLHVLDHVVGSAPPAEVTVTDHLEHVVGRLPLVGLRGEAGAQLLDGLTTETRQTSVQHEGHQGHDRFPVWPVERGAGQNVNSVIYWVG